MGDSLLENAIKKRHRLLAALQDNKIYQELKLVDSIIEFYGSTHDKQMNGSNVHNISDSSQKKKKGELVDDIAVECIESNSGKATKSQINTQLASKNVIMPPAHLAAYLSSSERVKWDKEEKVWVLK